MTESCKNCEHIHRLKHNFTRGHGFEESYACDVLAEDGGWIQEVDPRDRCELFKEIEAVEEREGKPKTLLDNVAEWNRAIEKRGFIN